jgi:hypothetical protein
VPRARLGLAGSVRPEHFDPITLREIRRADAIEHGNRRGRRHADRRELVDMMAHRGFVAPGPAGEDQRVDRRLDLVGQGAGMAFEAEHGAFLPARLKQAGPRV